MKKTDTTEHSVREPEEDDMLSEYHFDYNRASPNRFATDVAEGSLVVVLEPELAQVFKTSESVKAILRAITSALPLHEPELVSG